MNAQSRMPEARRVPLVVGGILLAVYGFTVAPDITLWDSGEFNAAVAALGIPHPPGTPLYIVMGHVWTRMLGLVPPALALNLLSAVATAAACGLLGGLMAKWTRSRLAGVAAGLTAGSMLAVWNNATETEIYAVSMLLAVLMVVVGDLAGERDSARLRALLAYLIGLALPIQVSALVAAPAAIALAATRPGATRPDVWRAVPLGGALAIVIGVSQGSTLVGAIGVVTLVVAAVRGARGSRAEPAMLALVALLGMSATLFMLVRAAHDPLVNQGNPATLGALIDHVTRQQYPLPGLWPRQAPVWIQALTLVQYADWQVASGLDDSVAASWWRTPFSLLVLGLAIAGARWHWRADARTARTTAFLLACASLGVVVMLNLRAGPSILQAVLPPGAGHEPRERDYFFALAFVVAGAWAGAGAVVAARRWWSPARPGMTAAVALAIAALPLALNWNAANRRPEAMLAPTLGESLLASAPRRAVLLVAGDNDSYTTWYRQAALHERLDVVPVTLSLLPAGWYRQELARRHQLLDDASVASWKGDHATLQSIFAQARVQGRPFAAAVTVPYSVRQALAPAWTLGGMAYVAEPDAPGRGVDVERGRTGEVAGLIARRLPPQVVARSPVAAYVARVLRCPSQALQLGSGTSEPADTLLDSRCNYR